MEWVLACNWDEALLAPAKEFGVTELFGKLPQDPVGGGRATFISPSPGRRKAERFIHKTLQAGIEFNYLLNGTCLSNREMTRGGQKALNSIIDWAADQGVTWFTVSIPYLAAKIRKRLPNAHIAVSMMAGVDSVEKAVQWENAGASVVILFENKDFALIRSIKKQTRLKVEVSANLSCLNRCNQSFYHGNVSSHSSNGSGLFSLPLCEAQCGQSKVAEPRRIVAGQWMRPQDVPLFEAEGVDRLKILDRTSPTPQLLRNLAAYATGEYEGNLADLIPGYRQERLDGYFSPKRALKTAAAFFKPQHFDVTKALAYRKRSAPPHFHIDGKALDGYLEGFLKKDCRTTSCLRCGWCDAYAQKAIRFPDGERERFLKDNGQNLRDLQTGDFFFYGPVDSMPEDD